MAMFRRLPLAYLAVALTAGITGCGSSSASPLAEDSVAAIIAEATANTIAAQSFTMSGGTSASDSVDLTIVHGLGCSGTIVQGTTMSKLIWIGTTVYEHTSGMPADEWMKGPSTTSSVQGLLALCTPSSLLAPLSATGANGATRSVTVYDGQPALALTLPGTEQDPGQTGSIIVTDTKTPVLLGISEAGFGEFIFTGYGAAKTITPPTTNWF